MSRHDSDREAVAASRGAAEAALVAKVTLAVDAFMDEVEDLGLLELVGRAHRPVQDLDRYIAGSELA
jgi:hypothetical protein